MIIRQSYLLTGIREDISDRPAMECDECVAGHVREMGIMEEKEAEPESF